MAFTSRSIAILSVLAIATALVACGGGSVDSTPIVTTTVVNPLATTPTSLAGAPERVRALAAAAIQSDIAASPYGVATPSEAAEQLFVFGEKYFPQYFPTKEMTVKFEKGYYRYYPSLGTYLAVASGVTAGDGLVEGGVYVLGGALGNSVAYIATVSQIITPTTGLHYTDKVYAIWTGAYIYSVTKDGVTKVKNMTQYTTGFWPLARCWMMDPSFLSQTQGKVLAKCEDATTNGRHTLYIDPTKEELYEFTGDVPANIVWHDVTPLDIIRKEQGWDAQAPANDGWYYTVGTSNWVLWFLDNKTKTSKIVKQGDWMIDGNINFLASYTN